MGNLVPNVEKDEKVTEKPSFDVEENIQARGVLPRFWPADGKIYGKFKREPHREMAIYSHGPVLSEYYSSRTSVVSRMFVNFLSGESDLIILRFLDLKYVK